MSSFKDSGIPFLVVFATISLILLVSAIILTVLTALLIKFTIPMLIIISCVALFFLVSWQFSRRIWKYDKKERK